MFIMIPRLFCFVIGSFCLAACQQHEAGSSIKKKKTGDTKLIYVQPFQGISISQTQYFFSELKKVYPFIELKSPVELPESAYHPARNRYRADSLISFLRDHTAAGCKTVGLTNKDISTTKNGIADWGGMGLGFCPGTACVASAFRLSRSATGRQLFKVAIHELGHTFGLPHCSKTFCFMRDAEGKNPTDEEKSFCTDCKAVLLKQGWNLG